MYFGERPISNCQPIDYTTIILTDNHVNVLSILSCQTMNSNNPKENKLGFSWC